MSKHLFDSTINVDQKRGFGGRVSVIYVTKNFIEIGIDKICLFITNQNQEIEPEFFSREAEGLILYKVSKYHVIRSIWAHKNDEGVLSFKKRYN